jgi:hypothetical protein
MHNPRERAAARRLENASRAPSSGSSRFDAAQNHQRREDAMIFAKRIAGAAALGTAMLIGSGLSAQAGYLVTLEQQGPNVIASGGGSIDLTGLGPVSTGGTTSAQIAPTLGRIVAGPVESEAGTAVDRYTPRTGLNGPSSFGSGPAATASSGSGDLVGLIAGNPAVFDLAVPVGYLSGSPLSDTSSYDNKTLASLGVTLGTYEWTWGSGANQNFTLNIIAAPAVSEPSSLLLLTGALVGLVLLLSPRPRAWPPE